ncbi:MAG TPA: wax ester/triacylglycerol synthase family O-acyltransferase [Mycobacteriales bacterium]|jgi:WS/DGAT/MGAT family acyltransferase|nr:wax ester/triacylglycerol synthase family O-acyltransferase [Mycobacteriales bacterium]
MTDRLSALDVSFLYLEEPTTPMHVGGVAVFRPPAEGLDYDELVALVEQRIALVPRYRQRVKQVPGHLAKPVWIDDPDFDITYHVRRSALPRPGTDQQLRELVGRLISRRLDRHRPLWEMYLVEGLSGGRVAVVTKTHHAMVDGAAAVDLAQVMLDDARTPAALGTELWMPRPEPGAVGLVADAVSELIRRPSEVADTVRLGLLDARATVGKVAGTAVGLLATARSAARPAPDSPLNAEIGEQRRFGTARTDLADYKAVRGAHGGTVNDVALATVAGALRSWMLTRGQAVMPGTIVRALAPVSVRGDEDEAENQVSSYLVDLPIGEPSPIMRLHQVSYAMKGHKDAGQAVGADALVRISGFAPPTLHALGARTASGLSRRLFNLVVTNVPGPQSPLYAAGAEMLEVYPVVPLAKGQAVSIGLTSYNGGVYYGLNADRDAMPDVDVLAQLIEESLAELVGLSG